MEAVGIHERCDLWDHVLVRWSSTSEDIARICAGRLVYLASPVTDRIRSEIGRGCTDWYVVERLIMECAIDLDHLARVGVSAVSPVLLALEMIRARGMGDACAGPMGALDRDYWMRWSAPIQRAAFAVVVVNRPGWDVSSGICAEVETALSANAPVFFQGGMPR